LFYVIGTIILGLNIMFPFANIVIISELANVVGEKVVPLQS